MQSRAYVVVMGFCCVFSIKLFGMEEEFITPHTIFYDGGSARENIGKLNVPQIGVYATPYHMAFPMITLHSNRIIDAMSQNILQQLAAVYNLSGTPEEIQNALHHKIATQELNVALVFWKGLPSQPPVYNAVFHPIVGSWLGLNYTASFNVSIQAGIFNAHGIHAASDAPIVFNTLGALEINRHDIDNYSPNNGKFAVEAGRAVATFWLMGAHSGRATVSYNVLLVQPEIQQAIEETVDLLAFFPSPAQEVEQLMGRLEQLVKTLDGEGRHADSNALYGTVEVLRKIVAFTSMPLRRKSIAPAPSRAVPADKSYVKHDFAQDLSLLAVQLDSLNQALRA